MKTGGQKYFLWAKSHLQSNSTELLIKCSILKSELLLVYNFRKFYHPKKMQQKLQNSIIIALIVFIQLQF